MVGARLNSSRLPGKHLLDLAGAPLIARIFQRLDAVPELHQSVLATTADTTNEGLVNWAEQNNRPVLAYEGDINDLMGRVDAVVQAHNPDVLVYICGDCPLLEPGFISRALQAMKEQPQTSYIDITPGEGGGLIHQGIDIYRTAFWKKVLAVSQTASEREHVGSARFPLLKTEPFVRLREPDIFYTRPTRISVDTPSDYRFMNALYRMWYANHQPEEIVSLSWVINTLDERPDLRAINENVHQKSVHEKSQAIILACTAGTQTGLGHLRRMLAVARVLTDNHAAGVRMVIEGDATSMADLDLVPHRFCEQLEAVLPELVTHKQPDAIVFDVPQGRLNKEMMLLLQSWKDQGVRLISVDFAIPDHTLITHDHIPCFYCPPSRNHTKVGFGWDHYLLEGGIHHGGSGLLVLTGGSDAYGLGQTWPGLLDKALPLDVPVVWIRGPYAPAPAIPWDSQRSWTVVHNPEHMATHFAAADMALTVYGVSFFECLAFGLPTVSWVGHDGVSPEELEALDAAKITVRAPSPEAAVTQMVQLWQNKARQEALAAQARLHMTGNGPNILAGKILKPTESA